MSHRLKEKILFLFDQSRISKKNQANVQATMLTCISLAAKFEGEYDVLEAVFQYLVEVPFAPSKSEVWLAETQIWDEFSQHNQCNLDF